MAFWTSLLRHFKLLAVPERGVICVVRVDKWAIGCQNARAGGQTK